MDEPPVLTGDASRTESKKAETVLVGANPESHAVLYMTMALIGLGDVFFGQKHHTTVLILAGISLSIALTIAGALVDRHRTPEKIEMALATLTHCSDMKALHVLMRFVSQPGRSVEETVRFTARHLPMARRALAGERRFFPGGLPAWIETLRRGGVVSEDLEFVARRVAELDSPLNADIGVWFRRLFHRSRSDRSG